MPPLSPYDTLQDLKELVNTSHVCLLRLPPKEHPLYPLALVAGRADVLRYHRTVANKQALTAYFPRVQHRESRQKCSSVSHTLEWKGPFAYLRNRCPGSVLQSACIQVLYDLTSTGPLTGIPHPHLLGAVEDWERWLFHLMHRNQHRVQENKETEKYVLNKTRYNSTKQTLRNSK